MTPLDRLERLTLKLAGQERMLSEFFNLARDCMVIYDSNTGNIVRVNKRWTELFGYSYEEMEGMAYDHMLHPGDVARTHARVIGRMTGKIDGEEAFRNHYVGKQGQIVELEWRGSNPHNGLIFAVARPIDQS